MDYKGKRIYEEDPVTAKEYRQRYVDGVEEFIKRLNHTGRDKQRENMSPEQLNLNREFYRKQYIQMLGLDRFLREE